MRADVAAVVTEAAFLAAVLGAAETFGWRAWHDYDARRNRAGWPDVILLRGDRLIALELKSERGRVRPEQAEWLRALDQVPGVVARVARPRDWDTILELLR